MSTSKYKVASDVHRDPGGYANYTATVTDTATDRTLYTSGRRVYEDCAVQDAEQHVAWLAKGDAL